MSKKIVAVFCIIILMISVLSACGDDKGYLQAEDSEGYVRAFVTDENGETVLNEDGEIRIYVTDPNGDILKDSNGVPRESSVAMPDTVITDTVYQTKEFVFNTPSGWRIGEGVNIAYSKDGLSKIQFGIMDEKADKFNSLVADGVEMAKEFVDIVKESNGTAELKEGTAKLTSNQIDAYYLLFDAELEADGEKQILHTCDAYLIFEGRVYKAYYQTVSKEGLTIEQVAEVFSNLTINHIENEETKTETKAE